jgi:hypothetical protein
MFTITTLHNRVICSAKGYDTAKAIAVAQAYMYNCAICLYQNKKLITIIHN